jgi:sec-independent protein translocase protein TatB
MFDIGFSEIVVIFGLALVVLGPDKLPRIAQTVGRWAGRARAMARQFRDQLEQEANQIRTSVDPNAPVTPARPVPPASPAGGGPVATPMAPAPGVEPPPPPAAVAMPEPPPPPGEGAHREPPGGAAP